MRTLTGIMMIDSQLVVLLTVIGLIAVTIVCVRRKTRLPRTLLLLALTIYVGVVVSITLFPIPINNSHDFSSGIRYNIIPFDSILNEIRWAQRPGFWWVYMNGVIGNILMFMPLGFMLPLLSKKFKKPLRAFTTVLVCSVLIELTQLAIGFCLGNFYRAFDVDDIILNTLGGVLGYLAFLLWSRLARALSQK